MYNVSVRIGEGLREMLNNINDNNKDNLLQSPLSDLTQGVNSVRFINRNPYASNPYAQGLYIDKTDISDMAMKLVERDNDIKKFTQIAMSDENDQSHMALMEELFSQGISDPFDESILAELSENSDLWDDLGL